MPFPPSYDQGSSDRGLSTKLWKDVNAQAIASDPRRGWVEHVNFQSPYTSTDTQATAGTAAVVAGDAGEGPVLELDSASTTATQGINSQFGTLILTPTAGYDIYFEARVKATDIATGPEFFCGLSVVDTSIIASSANSSTDYCGFYSVTDDNVLLFATEDGGTQALETATIHTLVDGTYVKLGFVIRGTGDTADAVEVYVDGTQIDTVVTPDCPSGTNLVPSFVCQSGGTTDPIVEVDWFQVAQIPA